MIFNFKKKCAHCGAKIEKGAEVFREVRSPEFCNLQTKAFCSVDHAETYKTYMNGTPCKTCGIR